MSNQEPLKTRIAQATKSLRLASPEWRALLAAIRRGDDAQIVAGLAEAACLDQNGLAEVAQMIRIAPKTVEDAARAPGLAKQWQKIESHLDDLRASFGQATCDNDRAKLAAQIGELDQRKRTLAGDFYTTQQAVATLAALKSEGIC